MVTLTLYCNGIALGEVDLPVAVDYFALRPGAPASVRLDLDVNMLTRIVESKINEQAWLRGGEGRLK